MKYNCYEKFILKNGTELLVRNIELDDAKMMIGLVETADTQTRFLSREPGEYGSTEEQERELITQKCNDENVLWIVGEIDGKIVANCLARRLSCKMRFRHRAKMSVVVLKENWRLGIGRILIQDIIRWCNEKGYEQLELDVVANNEAAISLYKSVGFEVCGTRKNAFKYDDGTYADQCLMIKSLI